MGAGEEKQPPGAHRMKQKEKSPRLDALRAMREARYLRVEEEKAPRAIPYRTKRINTKAKPRRNAR
jgi:hypothetical protein